MNASLKPSNPTDPIPSHETLRARLKRLNLYGLLAQAEEIRHEPWLLRVLEIEEGERQSRSSSVGSAMLGCSSLNPLPTSITPGLKRSIVNSSRNS
jgi:hypothetical protein